MLSKPRSAPVQRPAPSPQRTPVGCALLNRRVTIRYSANAAVITGIARQRRSLFTRARVQDVSQGGVALVLRHAPALGETIYLQVTNRILEFTFDLAAEVRHVSPGKAGTFVVGLEFAQTLSLAELAALL